MKKNKITAFVFVVLFLSATSLQTALAQSNQPKTQFNTVLINSDPAPVQSGDDAEAMFKIWNSGDMKAENVTVQIIDTFPFKLKPDRKRNYSLGKVFPGQEYQISTELLVADDAPDGLNSLKVRISERNSGFSVVHEIPVQVQSQDIEMNLANLKTSPSTLTSDMENAKITVELVNNGGKTAENVVLNLDLPESFQRTSSFSTRQSVGNMKPGEVKSAEFRFDISESAKKGLLNIPTELSYFTEDSNNKITEGTSFELFLAGKPQFEVTNISENLVVGGTEELEVMVKNTGTEKSSSTRIRVLDSADLPFSYESPSQYIGTLKPGQTGSVVFDVTTESDAKAKNYLLDLEVRGVKNTEVYVEDKTVEAGVKEDQQSSQLPVRLSIGLAVLLLISGTYFFREKVFGSFRSKKE